MKTALPVLALTLSILFGAPALAGTISKVSITPPGGAQVGQKVTVQIDLTETDTGICGIEVEFGDGQRNTFKIKPDTKLPIVVEHAYKTPGEPKLRVAGNRVENALSCSGKEITMYKVSPAPATAAAPAASACPAEWSLKGKVGKDGSFTCVPAKGVKDAKKPAQPLPCPAGTSYFTKGKSLGCEKG